MYYYQTWVNSYEDTTNSSIMSCGTSTVDSFVRMAGACDRVVVRLMDMFRCR